MDHFKDLETVFCQNPGHELNQCAFPEDRLKHVDNNETSKNVQNSNMWEIRDWQTINNNDEKNIINTNNSDDLISFKDVNVNSLVCIDDTPNHINLKPEKHINLNSKYYDDLKAVFGTSNSEDDSYRCTEKVILGKVNTLKTENKDMYKDSQSCTENLTLGRVTTMKNTNKNTSVTKTFTDSIGMEFNKESKILLGEIPGSSVEKGVDLVDIFENISVTPKDITQQLNKSDANIENKNQFSKSDNQHGPVQMNFEGTISKNNELVSVLPNLDAKTVLASKDDKIIQVQGNNITIKCDRTYVISPGHVVPSSTGTVFCKRHERADEEILSRNVVPRTTEEKPEKLFAKVPNGSVDRATEILKNSLKALNQTVAAKLELSEDNIKEKFKFVKHFDDMSTKKAKNNTTKTLINYDERGQPWFSKEPVEETKATSKPTSVITKETLKTTIHPENSTEMVSKGIDSRTVKFVPEVLEENHALRRCLWQKQQAAIDEFIHGRKVIMGKEKY